ncbi:Shikimate kinase [Dickeya chrysanthemi Ech1591]|uniref:Shikimate kinase 2 n=1 Tax=Dickeya chrysanthemi (strain Ech1591) TaxID=561229 RepID=C6CEM9_DICC1|nr:MULTISPECIES: shikimate kinase AroL [Dickeya]ACT07935.1 Shikimate kinase [Dickeya chrysanthemi Ech1591]TYL44272.1 shikimate kinase AroL [Dickeya sp. ws52]WJM86392.1 shikimate kinase AroL [Dickeya chrysanthemi]
MTQPIFMVGARGCGKTTVGGELAQALGYDFVDTDIFMQHTSGLTVADVVAAEGWPGFRRRESDALQAVTTANRIVATGGGMVLLEQNREFMRAHGTVVYLHAPAQELAQRLQASPQAHQRPTLTGRPIAEEMEAVLREREALYQDVAHYVVDATRPPAVIVAELLQTLRLPAA